MIRKLKIEIKPEAAFGDVHALSREVFEEDGILGYRKVFAQTEVMQSSDWKSHWDYMWEMAKREFEKAQDSKKKEPAHER